VDNIINTHTLVSLSPHPENSIFEPYSLMNKTKALASAITQLLKGITEDGGRVREEGRVVLQAGIFQGHFLFKRNMLTFSSE